MENAASSSKQSNYTVVARRYRPKNFGELIGQDHIAQALGKAISSNRVGHAYLFTGARGVGKTSTARIFAKVLNTPEGMPEEVVLDISQAIDSGDDMDVIEIDGASNRGIEEIRQLRANVNVRPSRSRYKIYIIDEVHMLTNQAFNALLKTLEEPPAHVKFIFCTTDPDKIPITVLSRCQRFDFVPVKFEAIQLKLSEICASEGYLADVEALALLARRAAGSMRDSQSLLEQVMSFSTDRITVEQVHTLLGTADEGRLMDLVAALRNANALQAIQLVDDSTRGGADAGQLAEQLMGYLRDIMAVGIGGGPELLKLANPGGHAELKSIADSWGLQTILSAIQILDESLMRMRSSVSSTTLLEVALVQICQLEQLASIPELLERVMQSQLGSPLPSRPAASSGASRQATASPEVASSAAEKKNDENEGDEIEPSLKREPARSAEPSRELGPAVAEIGLPQPDWHMDRSDSNEDLQVSQISAKSSEPPATSSSSAHSSNPKPSASTLTPSTDALEMWRRALAGIDGMLADFAGMARAVEPNGSDHWNIVFPPGSSKPCEYCEHADRRPILQQALQSLLNRQVRLTFSTMPGQAPAPAQAVAQSSLRAQKMREMSEHPYVKKLCEVLDGEIIRVDPPRAIPTPKMMSTQTRVT